MKKLSLAIALSLGVALSGCDSDATKAKGNQEQATQHSERADNYLRQGQYRAAIIEARNAIKLSPNEPRHSVMMARALNDVGQFKAAAQELEPFAKEADAVLAGALLEAYIGQKKYQTAIDYLSANSARLGVDNNPELLLLKARALSAAGQFDNARPLLQSLQANPKIATRARLESARDMAAHGDTEGALALTRQILETEPKHIDTLLFAARLAERKGDLAAAEDQLGRALIQMPQTDVLTPTKIAVLETLSSVLTKLGRSSEALVYTKALSDADPERMRMQEKFNKGLELFQAGNLAEAEPLLTEVYQQSKNDTAGILLGMIKYATNDLEGAAQYFTDHVDPEVAPDEALLALAATDLRSAQPQKLLEMFGPEQRARLKNPELKALIGIALLETGNATEGESMITQALTEQPENPAIATTLARHYLMSRQGDKALDVLQKTLIAHPGDATVNRLLISGYLAEGENSKALQAAQKFAAAEPAKADNLAVLGRTALALKESNIAADALQKALKLDPKNESAQIDLAQLYLQQKQPQKAEPLFAALIEANPANIQAIKGLITARELANGREATANSIEEWMPGLQTSPVARAVTAEYFVRNNRLADAERALPAATAATDAPETPYVGHVRQMIVIASANQAAASKDFARARNELVQALRSNPDSIPLLNQLARLELRANAPQEAEKVVVQLEQLQQQSPEVEELKADIAAAQQRWPDAVARYRTLWERTANEGIAVKLHRSLQASDTAAAAQFLGEWQKSQPKSATPYLLQGMLAEQAGDTATAIRSYEAVLARDADNTAALNNLALLYLPKGEPRARELAARAYQAQPQNAAVLDTYGWILTRMGEREKGIDLIEQALKLAPTSADIREHLEQAKAGK